MTHNGAVGLSVRGVVCEIVGSFAASQAGGPLRRLRLLFSVPVTHAWTEGDEACVELDFGGLMGYAVHKE